MNQSKITESIITPTALHTEQTNPKSWSLRLVSLLTAVSIGVSGCDTPGGARAAAGAFGAAGGAAAGWFLGGGKGRRGVQGAIAGAGLGYGLMRMSHADWLFKSKQLKFQEAVLKGDTAAASRYVNASYVNTTIKGQTPIYYAAVRGDIPMIRLLASHGASLHSWGHSLAYVAASSGHPGAAHTLVTLGAGTSADVAAGSALYAANEKARREQARAMLGVALLFVSAAIASNANASHDNSQSDADRRLDAMDRHARWERGAPGGVQ